MRPARRYDAAGLSLTLPRDNASGKALHTGAKYSITAIGLGVAAQAMAARGRTSPDPRRGLEGLESAHRRNSNATAVPSGRWLDVPEPLRQSLDERARFA